MKRNLLLPVFFSLLVTVYSCKAQLSVDVSHGGAHPVPTAANDQLNPVDDHNVPPPSLESAVKLKAADGRVVGVPLSSFSSDTLMVLTRDNNYFNLDLRTGKVLAA